MKVSHQCGNWSRGTCLDRSGRLIISNLNSIIWSDWLAHMFHYHFGTCRHSCELCAADPDLGFALLSSTLFFSFSPAISDDDNEGKKCLTSHPQALFFSQLRDHWVLKAMASRKSEPDDISAHHLHDSDGSANINQKQTVLDTDVERRAGGDEGPLPTEKLRRGLSARQVQMIAIAGTIGTGLFLGTGRSLAQGGPASIFICYGVVGFIVYVTLLLLGEMGTQYPVAGMC